MRKRLFALAVLVTTLIAGFGVVQAGSHWEDYCYIEGQSDISYTPYSGYSKVTWNSYTYSHDVEGQPPDDITLDFCTFRDGDLVDSGCPPAIGSVYLGDGGTYPREEDDGIFWDIFASHSATFGSSTPYESSYDDITVYVSQRLQETQNPSIKSREKLIREKLIAMYVSRLQGVSYEIVVPFTDLARVPLFSETDKNDLMIHLLCAEVLPGALRIGDPKPGVALMNQDTVCIVIAHRDGSNQLLLYRWNESEWISVAF